MYVITKTVHRSGKLLSQVIIEDLIDDWNTAQDTWKRIIKERKKEAKKTGKAVTYNGSGEFVTLNGFVARYDIHLMTKITPEG